MLRKDMEAQMANITGTAGSGTLTGGNHNGATDSAEGDDLAAGRRRRRFSRRQCRQRQADRRSECCEPRESRVAQPISVTPPTASGMPMI
jgi:hypothetical protein